MGPIFDAKLILFLSLFSELQKITIDFDFHISFSTEYLHLFPQLNNMKIWFQWLDPYLNCCLPYHSAVEFLCNCCE